MVEEIEDRYGPMPEEVLNLVEYGRIRILADRMGIEKIDRQGSIVVFTFKEAPPRPGVHAAPKPQSGEVGSPVDGGGTGVSPVTGASGPDPARVVRLVREHPDVTLVPPSGLKLDLKWKAKVGARTRPSGPFRPSESFQSSPSGSRQRSGGGSKPGFGANTPSWWTARATEEEVKPGFSKEAIVRPHKEDPRRERRPDPRWRSLERAGRKRLKWLIHKGLGLKACGLTFR